MKCPYCGKEMIEGFIHCHNGLYDIAWKSNDKSQKKIVVRIEDSFWESKIKQVFYCPSCNVIIKHLE